MYLKDPLNKSSAERGNWVRRYRAKISLGNALHETVWGTVNQDVLNSHDCDDGFNVFYQ